MRVANKQKNHAGVLLMLACFFFCINRVPCAAQWQQHPTLTNVWHKVNEYDFIIPLKEGETWNGVRWPTLCYLHGMGGEIGIAGQKEIEKLYPFLSSWAQQHRIMVIVPRYQFKPSDDLISISVFRVAAFQRRSEQLLEQALTDLAFFIDRNRFSMAGHSLGCLLTLRIASLRAAGIPVPRALALLDPAGYEVSPLLGTNPLDPMAEGFNMNSYDDFSGIGWTTQIACLIAEQTWLQSFADLDQGSQFGNSTAGGVISRAWHRTRARKHFLRVNSHPYGPLSQHAGAVDNSIYTPIYWRHVADLLKAANSGATYAPALRLVHTPTFVPQVSRLTNIPAPAEYAWKCQHRLPEDVVQAIVRSAHAGVFDSNDLRVLLEHFLSSAQDMWSLNLIDFVLLMHLSDLVQLEERDWEWLSFRFEAAFFKYYLPCGDSW